MASSVPPKRRRLRPIGPPHGYDSVRGGSQYSYRLATQQRGSTFTAASPITRGRAATQAVRGTATVGQVSPQGPPRPPDTPVIPSTIRRGFDADGNPYYEVTLVDGSIKRVLRSGTVIIIKPDGTEQTFPPQFAMSQAPTPDPPLLPTDPARGRAWVQRHNENLLDVIRTLVKNDVGEMQKFSAGEAKDAGTDIFKQIAYRTKIAGFLIGAQ